MCPLIHLMRALARSVLSVVPLLAAYLASTPPSLAAPAQAPGSRLVLDMPKGFAASPMFSGFIHAPTGATIILLEVPASAYPDMTRGLSPQTLASQGVIGVETRSLVREGEYLYVTAEQPAAAGPFAKFILLFREGPITALVSASVPKTAIESGLIEPQDFEKILESVRAVPGAAEKPFALAYTGPFRDTGAFIGQSHFYAIVDRPGGQRAPATTPPSLIVAASPGGPRIDDLEAAGRAGVTELIGEQEPQEIQSRPLDVAGLAGIEHVAPPSDSGPASGTGIYQVILRAEPGGYYRIVAKAPAPEWPALLPEFRKIAQSFSPRP